VSPPSDRGVSESPAAVGPGPGGPRICFLHIGLHKTASTTMQRMLLANVGELAALGIYVPEASTNNYRRIHHELAEELNSPPGRSSTRWFERLREELEAEGLPPRVLLSSEDFSRKIHRGEVLGSLQSFFGDLGYGVRVIAYLRPQERSMNSTYTQHVRALLLGTSFSEYLESVLRENPPWFDYHRLLAPVLDTPGFECDIRPFNRATLETGVVEDLLAAVGVLPEQAASFRKVPAANITPGPRTIAACAEMARRLGMHGVVLGRAERWALSRRLHEAATAAGWDGGSFSGLTPEGAARVRAHFTEGNDLLSRRVWGRPWGDVFEREIAEPVVCNEFDPSGVRGAEREEFFRVVDEVWQAVKEELVTDPRRRERPSGPAPDRPVKASLAPAAVPVPEPARSAGGGAPKPLLPILVLLSGRSGSTLLMELLGTSPLIAFDRVYPYEDPYLLYLVRMARLLDQSGRPSKEWGLRHVRRPDLARFGPLPVGRRAQILNHRTVNPLWVRSLRALWGEFSDQARAAMPAIVGEDAPAPTMYAEKAPSWLPPLLEEAGIGHRLLYLLRDPRDIHLSILAFNAKRGISTGFGMKADDTPESFARRFAAQRRSQLEPIVSGAIPSEQVVRYDRMVSDLEGEARRLGAVLGVALDAAAVQPPKGKQGQHVTAGSVVASVGRWQREMSPEIQAIFAAELGDLLIALGWEA